MSERKSWDVQRKQGAPKATPTSASTPTPARPQLKRAPQPVETMRRRPAAPPTPVAKAKPVQQVRRPSTPPSGTLKQRRKQKRRAMRYVGSALFLIILAAAFYAAWLPALRVQSVEANGPNAQAAQSVARMKLLGTYAYILPRNSIFFFPTQKIRSAILDAAPDVSAVSITRLTFSSIEVRTTPRATSFLWCGTSIETTIADGSCFDADIEGLIFKEDPSTSTTTATTTQHVNGQVRVFSALDKELAEGQSPVRAHVASPVHIPDALKFVDAIRQLGAPVSSLGIRGDEADLWLNGPTRITYILGHEKEAAELAASALPTLQLSNGSIKYVDLRFPGKAYVMRYGEAK